MVALFVALAAAVAVLTVVLICHYRPALAARVVAPVRGAWRRASGVDYGRHAHAATPPGGVRMRDPRGGVNWTSGIPTIVPKDR